MATRTLKPTTCVYLVFADLRARYLFSRFVADRPPMCTTWIRASSRSVVSRPITASGHSRQDITLCCALLTHLNIQRGKQSDTSTAQVSDGSSYGAIDNDAHFLVQLPCHLHEQPLLANRVAPEHQLHFGTIGVPTTTQRGMSCTTTQHTSHGSTYCRATSTTAITAASCDGKLYDGLQYVVSRYSTSSRCRDGAPAQNGARLR